MQEYVDAEYLEQVETELFQFLEYARRNYQMMMVSGFRTPDQQRGEEAFRHVIRGYLKSRYVVDSQLDVTE